MRAHVVAKDSHDRKISVYLQQNDAGQMLIRIDYRVEVDETTVVFGDMAQYADEVDATLYARKPLEYYAAFAGIFGKRYAANLLLRVNGKLYPLHIKSSLQTLEDEQGKPLQHLRCDFTMQAIAPLQSDQVNTLTLRETNYRNQEGKISWQLAGAGPFKIVDKTIPDPKLNELSLANRPLDFDTQLRSFAISFEPGPLAAPMAKSPTTKTPAFDKSEPTVNKPIGKQETASSTDKTPTDVDVRQDENNVAARPELHGNDAKESDTEHGHDDEFRRLFRWVRETRLGFIMMLFVFAGLGAAHALTPGHGKTLVAAYLVGERGTVWHALVLGLVTTLTHTGMVLALAAVLMFLPESRSQDARQAIQSGLGLLMGLLVAGLGVWLLLQRLAGGHDHIHIGGGHHHHHHGPNDSHEHSNGHHHYHGHTHATGSADASSGSEQPARGTLNWWGIVLLGMTGGIIPCWDAVAILFTVVGTSEFWLALPALLAFSAGLAGILVLIGILVVKFRAFASSRFGEGRLTRTLPIVSALFVTAMGIWLCYQSLPAG